MGRLNVQRSSVMGNGLINPASLEADAGQAVMCLAACGVERQRLACTVFGITIKPQLVVYPGKRQPQPGVGRMLVAGCGIERACFCKLSGTGQRCCPFADIA